MKTQLTERFREAMLKISLQQDIFFTDLLYNLKIEPHENLTIRGYRTPACTDGITLMYDTELYDNRPLEERVVILVHELLHIAMAHSFRRGARDPMTWNVACDYAINDLIVLARMNLPKDGLHDTRFRGLNAEEIYDRLLDENSRKQSDEGTPKPGGAGDVEGYGDGEGDFHVDVMDYQPSNHDGMSEDVAAKQSKGMVERATAVSQAHNAGKGSPLLDRLVELISVDKLPWHVLLSRFMLSRKSTESDWVRLNYKNLVLYNLAMPRRNSVKLGKIVVGIDCSGSIGEVQLSSMSAHLRHIMHDCAPEQLIVLYFDDGIVDIEEYDRRNYEVKLSLKGGGGTDFRPVFEKVSTLYSDAAALLMFTDMYGRFPDDETIPTVWLTSTRDFTPPFGEVIEADFND